MVFLKLVLSPLHLPTKIIIFFIMSITFGTSHDVYDDYKGCSSLVSCGKVQNIGYPFWGAGRPEHCGHPALQLECPYNHSDDYPLITFKLRDQYSNILQYDGDDPQKVSYRILNIQKYRQKSMTIKLQELPLNSTCPICFTSIEEIEFFDYIPTNENISLFYNCSPGQITQDIIFDSITCWNNITAYYLPVLPESRKNQVRSCEQISVPVPRKELDDHNKGNGTLLKILQQGFEVEYSDNFLKSCSICEDSGGICGSSDVSGFFCHCKESHYEPFYCEKSEKTRKRKLRLILGLGIPFGICIFIALNVGLCYCKKAKLRSPRLLSRIISSDPVNSDLEDSNSFHGIPVFSYHELEEATNSFDPTRELGDGGFGIVYYGKLRDGREVAVKRLYERNYKRVGQFKNEVEILTKLRHPNLVTLYGCTSRHSRELLLVYEYISNGTVADHLYGDQSGFGPLTWTVRMKIAIETASALSYLHTSDIIHRDVKTNNILLDSNFSVKVADFGLSRLFPFDVTHVSTAPQGTPGYLDPEYHKCYQVTSKSDVYSFGVVLIELISSLPAIDITRHEDEINLSDYAMNRIQTGKLEELVDRKLGFETDFKVKRMTTLVAELAFQCLQQEKEVRPSMEEVLEVLRQIERVDYEVLEADETGRSIGRTKTSSDNDVDQPWKTNNQHPPSPSSVIESWVSRSTASNPSG